MRLQFQETCTSLDQGCTRQKRLAACSMLLGLVKGLAEGLRKWLRIDCYLTRLPLQVNVRAQALFSSLYQPPTDEKRGCM